jgi:uncharacterized cupin superfamily protein
VLPCALIGEANDDGQMLVGGWMLAGSVPPDKRGRCKKVRKVNLLSVELDEPMEAGSFRHVGATLGPMIGAERIGAGLYQGEAGRWIWPFHYHHGVEEWLYVLAGTPVLRDPGGERTLRAGDLVAFPSGHVGAHTVAGPGRFVIFSTGDHIEPWLSVYPDSEKLSTPEGMLLLNPAVGYWYGEAGALESPDESPRARASAPPRPVVSLDAVNPEGGGHGVRRAALLPMLGAERLSGSVVEVDPGEVAEQYHCEYGRETWIIALSETSCVRHPGGEDSLAPGEVACFPEGPDGARQMLNHGDAVARALLITTQEVPSQVFYPDSGTWLLRTGRDRNDVLLPARPGVEG